MPRYSLSPLGAGAAFLFCLGLIVLGALLPLGWLAYIAVEHTFVAELRKAFFNSFLLAGAGALTTLVLAALIAVSARRSGAIGKLSLFASGMGYAAPGAVLALGAFSMFGLARELGWIGGVGVSMALVTLLWAYAARFAAAGAQPIDAGLARLSKGLDASARTLGAGPARRLWRIDLPIAAPSLAAAALILFVDILKELPATLIIALQFRYARRDRLFLCFG